MIFLRLFRNNRPTGIAVIFFLVFALFLPSIISQRNISSSAGMPLYNLLFGVFPDLPLLNRILALIITLILGNILIQIGIRFQLQDFRSFMPAVFFILFTMALPMNQKVNAILIGSIFYILCFAILFSVYDKPPDTFSVFSAGLVLAAGSMFYLKLIWFIPLIWISLGTLRSVTWREMVYPVIAFFLLGLFLFTWYWVVLNDPAEFIELLRRNLAFKGSWPDLHYSVFLYYGFFLLLVAISSFRMLNKFQTMKTTVQNMYQVLFYMFLAGILFVVVIERFDPDSLVFVAFPVAFILSNYFHRKRNPWTHELMMWILLALLVFVQFTI